MFPLARLPYVAVKEVIKSMSTQDLFSMSLTSSKTRAFIKLIIRTKQFQMKISVDSYIVIHLGTLKLQALEASGCNVKGNVYKICGEFMRVHFDQEEALCFYEKSAAKVEPMKNLIGHFMDAFNNPKIYFHIFHGVRDEVVLELIRYIKPNLHHVDLYSRFSNSETLPQILDECVSIPSLLIFSVLPDGYEYKCPSLESIRLEKLTIINSHWVNFYDFLHCKHVFLTFYGCRKAVQRINSLFRSILNTECRLESLDIFYDRPDNFPMIVAGLSKKGIQKIDDVYQVEVMRKDGKKSLIICHEKRIVMQTI